MQIFKKRTWAAVAAAFGTALVMVTAASADSASSTLIQRSAGTFEIIEPDDCDGLGLKVTGERFEGAFGQVTGLTIKALLLKGSNVAVTQNAVLCFPGTASPDDVLSYVGPFDGSVDGNAVVSKVSPAINRLDAEYGSDVVGDIDMTTGALAVQWTGGTWTVTGVKGIYGQGFSVGETGDATASAFSPNFYAPEVGSLDLTFSTSP